MLFGRIANAVILTVLAWFCISFLFESDSFETTVFVSKSEKNDEFESCTITSCGNLHKCVFDLGNLKVFVQPLLKLVDDNGQRLNPEPSTEFLTIRSIILSSQYYTSDSSTACLIIPGVDTLSTNRFKNLERVPQLLKAAAKQFPFEPNFLIFNFFGSPDLFADAIVASSRHLKPTFRRGFDIPIPSLKFERGSGSQKANLAANKIVLPLIFGEANGSTFSKNIRTAFGSEIAVVLECLGSSTCIDGKEINFRQVLELSDFVLLSEDIIGFESILLDVLEAGAIPVFISDVVVLPFDEIIDWSLFSLIFPLEHAKLAMQKLQSFDVSRISSIKKEAKLVFEKHFDSTPKIVLRTLATLEQRLIPTRIRSRNEVFDGSDGPKYLSSCDYFVPVILHRATTLDTKLQWILRYFLYSKTNASMIVVATEKSNEILEAHIFPAKSVPIRIVEVDSVQHFSDHVHNYESQCLIFVVDSNLPFSILDDRVMENGFNHASSLPHRTTVLLKDNSCPFEMCPHFWNPSFPWIPFDSRNVSDCALLSRPLEDFTWNSCSV